LGKVTPKLTTTNLTQKRKEKHKKLYKPFENLALGIDLDGCFIQMIGEGFCKNTFPK